MSQALASRSPVVISSIQKDMPPASHRYSCARKRCRELSQDELFLQYTRPRSKRIEEQHVYEFPYQRDVLCKSIESELKMNLNVNGSFLEELKCLKDLNKVELTIPPTPHNTSSFLIDDAIERNNMNNSNPNFVELLEPSVDLNALNLSKCDLEGSFL
mmetsp:Transcript_21432/g.28143  ORF Transcript_21432/g.28143 Transcript_21432/m.28143 type:complete len:158 (+) Transcript_21432:155-628(+)